MEPESSLQRLEEPATCPYPEPDKSNGYTADILQRQEHFKGVEATNILGLIPFRSSLR
jgi:hypothetical protein